MTFAELIEKVAEDAKISKKAAEIVIKLFLKHITRALKEGDKVTLVGFGTFSVVRRKARKGRNPQTGAPIKIKAKKVVKFRTGKKLREANGGSTNDTGPRKRP